MFSMSDVSGKRKLVNADRNTDTINGLFMSTIESFFLSNVLRSAIAMTHFYAANESGKQVCVVRFSVYFHASPLSLLRVIYTGTEHTHRATHQGIII
jgi:hypothetical protein